MADAVRYQPSPWRQKASGGHVGRNYILNAYRQIWPARSNSVELTMEMPRVMQMRQIDVAAHIEEELKVPHRLRIRAREGLGQLDEGSPGVYRRIYPAV